MSDNVQDDVRDEVPSPSANQATLQVIFDKVSNSTSEPAENSSPDASPNKEEPMVEHSGVILGWNELSPGVREFFPTNQHWNDDLKEVSGCCFNGIDQVTDDVLIMMVERSRSNIAIPAETVTFMSFVGCVHITDYAVKLMADTYKKIKELHLDGCPLITEKSLIYLQACSELEVLTMVGTSVSIKPKMAENTKLQTLQLYGCPLIEQGEVELSSALSLDPTKLIIVAKSNFKYDIHEFLKRDVQQQKDFPLKCVDLNNVKYTPGVKLAEQDVGSFNVFETCASVSIAGQYMSDRAVYIVPMDMDTVAALNPQVLFMARINNILAVAPHSCIILMCVHTNKNEEEISKRLIQLGSELQGYLDLQQKAINTNIEKWEHNSSGEVKDRHFQLQQNYGKMKRVAAASHQNCFSILQINAETSKVSVRWSMTGDVNEDDQTAAVEAMKLQLEQKFETLFGAKMDKAMKKIRTLSKSDITELKSFSSPPALVKTVTEAVLILLGHNDTSWKNFKKVVSDFRFIADLQNFDVNSVSDKILNKLAPYYRDEALNVNNLQRISTFAASMWGVIEYVYEYGTELKPEMDRLKALLDQTSSSLHKDETGGNEFEKNTNKIKTGPESILQMIRKSVKIQQDRNGPDVSMSDWSSVLEVEAALISLKDRKIVSLEMFLGLVKDKVTKDLRVLVNILKRLEIQGKCLFYPNQSDGLSCVVTDITWYMNTLNMLYVQKYTNSDMKNGARCMSLDPEVIIFTEEVLKKLLPELSDTDRFELLLGLLLMQGLLLPLPHRSSSSKPSDKREWFLFSHMKSSFIRHTPDQASRAGRKYKEMHWPDNGHEAYSLTDIEIELNYRLTTSNHLELLPRFLSECIMLGDIAMATKNSWIARCGAVEIQFKQNIKQVNVSTTFDIQARTTKFENAMLPFNESVIHQYIWSALSQYLTVLDALICQYPHVLSRIRIPSVATDANPQVKYLLALGHTNGRQNLLPFHDFRVAGDIKVHLCDVRLYSNLPDSLAPLADEEVEWACSHCGTSEKAAVRQWNYESSVNPAFAGISFVRHKGIKEHVRGSLLDTTLPKESSTSSGHNNQVLVVSPQPLLLSGLYDVHITIIREGTVKLIVAKQNYFTDTFKHDSKLKKATMAYDLGTGIFSQTENGQKKHTVKSLTFEEFACKAGDTLSLHVSKTKLEEIAGSTDLVLVVDLMKNGLKFHTFYATIRSCVGILLTPSDGHAPSVVIQAPSFPMLTSRHYPINTALMFRVNDGLQWLLGHVVDQKDGFVHVHSGSTDSKMILVPGCDDMKPLSAMLDGLTVLYNKGVVKSRDHLRDYLREFNATPAPHGLFTASNDLTKKVALSTLKMSKHEPKICTMNINSPFVLEMTYTELLKDQSDSMRSLKASYSHIYLPKSLDKHVLLHPTRQFVHKWKEQELHFICNASSQFRDMHFMDMAPLDVTDADITNILPCYLDSVVNTYTCLLKRQQDILPLEDMVLPAVKDLPKQEVIHGMLVLLQIYKSTFILAQRLADMKIYMRQGGKVRTVKVEATNIITALYKQREQHFEPSGLAICKCKTHVLETLDDSMIDNLLEDPGLLKYASCMTYITIDLQESSPNMNAVLDFLKCLPNLQFLTLLNATSLDGIGQCKSLLSLQAPNGKYTSIPADLIQLKDTLTRLDISSTPVETLPDFITEFRKLTRLTITNTLIQELPEDIGKLKNLEKLMASYTLISSLPESFGNLRKLEHLNLNGVYWNFLKITKTLLVSKQVTMQDVKDKIIPLVESNLAYRRDMSLERWQGIFDSVDYNEKKWLAVEEWKDFNLELFDAFPRMGMDYYKKLSSHGGFPPQLFKCRNLRVLSMVNQGMRFLPDEVLKLPRLSIVNFSNCPHLKDISIELGKAPLKIFDVTGCASLKTPPQEIVSKGKKTVIAYLKRLSQGSVKTSRTKLMFVGLGGVGKTSLMRALMSKDHKAPHIEGDGITDGIDITTWNPQEKLTYSVWDFAGQTVYYNTHQFFMSSRAVYILVWNTRLGYQHSGLEFWMSSIACHCPDSPVFLVGTHADQITNTELPEANLSKRFHNIKGFFTVSSYTGQGIEKFSSELQRVTLDLPYMGGYIPEAWLNLEKAILMQRSDGSLLEWKLVETLAHDSGIYGDETKQAVSFLNDLGILQHFDNEFLRNRVIINPQWIVDVMACVVSVHNTVIKNGRLKHSDISKLWKSYPKELHDWLLRLTEVFDLTFPLDEKHENIIPCLLPSSEPEYDWPNVENDDTLMETKMLYRFEYLPAGLFNRAQVRLYQFSDDSLIWHTGSVLTKNDHYCLVKQTGDQNVLVKACGPRPENILLLVHEIFEGLIAEFFRGVKYEYQIPCSDCVKMGTTDPAMFSSVVLRRAISQKAYFLQCHTFFHTLSLTQLQSIIPPQSGSDFEIQMQNAVRELGDLEDTIRADVFFLMCKENIPSEEEDDIVHPRRIMEHLQQRNIQCWYEEDIDSRKSEDIDLAMRTAKLILVFISDEFVEDSHCQSLFLHISNRMKKDFILLMVGKERKWMNSALGGQVAGKVFINFQRIRQYDDKIKDLTKAVEDQLGRNKIQSLPPPDIFLSYCWSNSAEAIRLGHARPKEGSLGYGDPRVIKNFFEKHNISCWIDYQRVGQMGLFQDIAVGMKQAKAVVAFISDEYVMSDNCQMEFRFAHIALKKPIILAVIGTGYKWEATEIGMLALGYPKINFQVNNNTSHQDLLINIQELIAKANEKDIEKQRKESGPEVQKEMSVKEKAFQELYEMAQRKFLRQVSGYTEESEPFPRLFVADFNINHSYGDTDQDKDANTGEILVDGSDAKYTFVVDDLKSGQFCIKVLCEYEKQWHVTDTSYPIDLGGQELVQVWELVAPFMARVLSILKHSNINLRIIGTQEGQKLMSLMEQKAGIEYNTVIKPIYTLIRRYVQMKDAENEKGGLKRCHLPTGKHLWLCPLHQKMPRITVLEQDTRTEDEDANTQAPEYTLLQGLQELAIKWKERDKKQTEIIESRPASRQLTTASKTEIRDQAADAKTNSGTQDTQSQPTKSEQEHKVKFTQDSCDVNIRGNSSTTPDTCNGDAGSETKAAATETKTVVSSKDIKEPSTSTNKTPSRPASLGTRTRLSEKEKAKIVRRTSSRAMVSLGYDGHVESSRACVIL